MRKMLMICLGLPFRSTRQSVLVGAPPEVAAAIANHAAGVVVGYVGTRAIEAAELPVEVLGYPIDRYVIKIAFPEPDQDPLCHFVCLCFDKGFTDMRYLTVEKSAGIDGDTRPFLCGWTRDGRHENYGQCELEEALDRCVGLYLGEYRVEYLEDQPKD